MSSTSQALFAKDSWQTPRNARTLRAYMALRQQEIGQRIAELRHQRGNPPQEVVAAKLGVSYRAYQAWEAGDAKPAYRNLERLAEFYGVNEEYILTGARHDGTTDQDLSQLDRIEAVVDDLELKLDRVLMLLGDEDALAVAESASEEAERVARAPKPPVRAPSRARASSGTSKASKGS